MEKRILDFLPGPLPYYDEDAAIFLPDSYAGFLPRLESFASFF